MLAGRSWGLQLLTLWVQIPRPQFLPFRFFCEIFPEFFRHPAYVWTLTIPSLPNLYIFFQKLRTKGWYDSPPRRGRPGFFFFGLRWGRVSVFLGFRAACQVAVLRSSSAQVGVAVERQLSDSRIGISKAGPRSQMTVK